MPQPDAAAASVSPPSIANPLRLAPLPSPSASDALPRIRKSRLSPFLWPTADLVPLFYAALLFLAGITLAHFLYLRPGLLLAGLLPLAAIAILSIAKASRLTWLPLAAIWIFLGVWAAETEPIPAPSPAVQNLADGLLRTVEGTVVRVGPLQTEGQTEDEDSESSPPIQRLQQVDLQMTAAEVVTDNSDAIMPLPQAEVPRIRLQIRWPSGSPETLHCGERLQAVVRFLPPDTFHDAGVWDRAAYLEGQQINATGSLVATQQDSGIPRLTRLGSAPSSPACRLNDWRNTATARLQTLPTLTRKLPRFLRASPEDAAMLTALLVGDRTYLTRDLRAGFERTGSFHLIVVSGLHLAILAGFVLAACRKLRLPRLPSTAVTIAATFGYALFTGFAIPAQRSFWMVTLYLIGRLLYRDRSPLNVIGFATLCLAALSPRSIFDASLQMTILSVAAIAGIAVPLLEPTLNACIRATRELSLIALDVQLPPKIAQFRVTLRLIAHQLEPAANRWIAWRAFPSVLRSVLRLAEVVLITLVVELALALPMAIYFHRITVYALPVNMLILPLVGLLVPAAMLTLLALAIWPAAAALPSAACLAILHLSLAVVRGLGSLILSDLRIPDPSLFQIAVAVALFVLAMQLARLPGKLRAASFAALSLMALAAFWPRSIEHPANMLLFEAIDVGQGDSLLLISPEGKTLLVDAGGLGFPIRTAAKLAPPQFDIGEEVVSVALWSRGIRRLDAVALTHAHHDHMGGMAAILRNFHPRELWVGNNPPVGPYQALLQQAVQQGIPVRALHSGDSLTLGSATLRVLAPQPDYLPGLEPSNNDSLVLQTRYGDTSILLEGDAEAPEERTILAEPSLASALLKVGHHGSLTSTSPEFLAAIHPQYAVISCGRRNRFGHPRPEILAELQTARIRTFRTDIDGVTCFLLDGKSVTPQPMCSPPE